MLCSMGITGMHRDLPCASEMLLVLVVVLAHCRGMLFIWLMRSAMGY